MKDFNIFLSSFTTSPIRNDKGIFRVRYYVIENFNPVNCASLLSSDCKTCPCSRRVITQFPINDIIIYIYTMRQRAVCININMNIGGQVMNIVMMNGSNGARILYIYSLPSIGRGTCVSDTLVNFIIHHLESSNTGHCNHLLITTARVTCNTVSDFVTGNYDITSLKHKLYPGRSGVFNNVIINYDMIRSSVNTHTSPVGILYLKATDSNILKSLDIHKSMKIVKFDIICVIAISPSPVNNGLMFLAGICTNC